MVCVGAKQLKKWHIKTSRNIDSISHCYKMFLFASLQPVADAPVPGLAVDLPPWILLRCACRRYKTTGRSSDVFHGVRKRTCVTQRLCVIAALWERGEEEEAGVWYDHRVRLCGGASGGVAAGREEEHVEVVPLGGCGEVSYWDPQYD